MGFFKNLVNKISGGAACVFLEFDDPALGEAFQGKITATGSDSDLKIAKVYLKVRSIEKVVVRDYDIEMDGSSRVEDVHGQEIMFNDEFVISDAQTLKANQTYEWTTNLTLPDDALPTYLGKNAWHEWEFFAGLDAPGNDPDSGWIKVELY